MNFADFQEAITEAMEYRRGASQPLGGLMVSAVLGGVAIYLALAAITGTEQDPLREFLEGGAVTALSAVFMAMTAAYALTCFLLRSPSGDFGRWLWFLIGSGFVFLSLDELLQVHERIGGIIENSSIGPTETFRKWDDVIVIAYGFVALATLIAFLPELLRLPRVAEFLALGFGFYVVHTAIDSLVIENSAMKIIPEESAKLFSAAFFALAMLAALLCMARPANERRSP